MNHLVKLLLIPFTLGSWCVGLCLISVHNKVLLLIIKVNFDCSMPLLAFSHNLHTVSLFDRIGTASLKTVKAFLDLYVKT